jgi:hypothetical protein
MGEIMRTILARAIVAVVIVGAAALLPAGVAEAEEAPGPELSGPMVTKLDGFIAAPVDAGGAQAAPPPYHCEWGWDVEVGGFYPEAWLRYAATFECAQVGPDVAGTLQGSLHASPGGLRLHQGPDFGFAWCCALVFPPATSGGEITLTGPGSFYLNSNSIVDLFPDEQWSWVWTSLPAGCIGLGTPRAVCDIDSQAFDIT